MDQSGGLALIWLLMDEKWLLLAVLNFFFFIWILLI